MVDELSDPLNPGKFDTAPKIYKITFMFLATSLSDVSCMIQLSLTIEGDPKKLSHPYHKLN